MTIGLTGGIGSGKTMVARLFETMGCAIYNSDDRAKDVYFEPSVKQEVIALLGNEAYTDSVTLNKNFISEKIFSDNRLRQKLNAIIHPAVKLDFTRFIAQFPNQLIIKESAILFETGIYKDLDAMILVSAPIDQKIERVKKRNGISDEEVKKRMSSQWTDEQKAPLADYIVDNADDQALIPQVLTILKQLQANA